VAGPSDVGGLTDNILNPAYSTAIGLLLWGARSLEGADSSRYESAPAGGAVGRARDALRHLFP
jgi:cell division ATPase FtsA